MRQNVVKDLSFQSNKIRDDISLAETLAALIISGISMYAALLGLYLDNPFLFWGGVIVLIASAIIAVSEAIKATLGVIDAILNFKDQLKERRKRKLP